MLEQVKQRIKHFLPSFCLDYFRRLKDVPVYFKILRLYSPEKSSYSAIYRWLWPKKLVLFYPLRPNLAYAEYKLCALLGYTITDQINSKPDVVFRREIATQIETDLRLKDHFPNVINNHDIDISKQQVQDVVQQVFGYALEVDPLTYNDFAVKKSDQNYTHDGTVVKCPLPEAQIEQGYVYQRLIDNRTDENNIVDIRVAFADGLFEKAMLKHRPIKTRFENINSKVDVVAIETVLSPDEIKATQAFVQIMGLNYCELDILRDAKNGKVYIVDCNATPAFGPPTGMSQDDASAYLVFYTSAFQKMLKQHTINKK